jgi:valine dehydrogenase (NAD+)
VNVFGQTADGHEQVIFCADPNSGLHAIIAIYSTALGPALGGTRFYPFPDESAALTDVLNLSRAMAYKAACAGLDLGGGKAVIIGSPKREKTEPLLRAYGRFIQSLAGRYYTACDMGTDSHDMDVIARECRFVTGRTTAHGGAGDSAVLTAFGVMQGMRAAAERVWGVANLRGRRVGVSGVGKVGRRLVGHLLAEDASVVVADTDDTAIDQVRAQHPEAEISTIDELPMLTMDVFAPCALGGILSDEQVPMLQSQIVCGAANNQLAHPGVDKLLHDRGILYAPDYVVNAGGLIQVADEIEGFSEPRARARASQIFETASLVFALADKDGIPPGEAADKLACQRMMEVGRLRGLWLPAGGPGRY